MKIPANLAGYFWDTDYRALDTAAHKRYIIERILELGDDKAVLWMRRVYSPQEISAVLKKSRQISKKSRVFWSLVF